MQFTHCHNNHFPVNMTITSCKDKSCQICKLCIVMHVGGNAILKKYLFHQVSWFLLNVMMELFLHPAAHKLEHIWSISTSVNKPKIFSSKVSSDNGSALCPRALKSVFGFLYKGGVQCDQSIQFGGMFAVSVNQNSYLLQPAGDDTFISRLVGHSFHATVS